MPINPPADLVISDDFTAAALEVIRHHPDLIRLGDLLAGIAGLIESGRFARENLPSTAPLLASMGLTAGRFNDLVTMAEIEEARGASNARSDHNTYSRGGLFSHAARRVVVLLWLRGLEPDVIAQVTQFPLDDVLRTIEDRPNAHPLDRAFVAGTLEGRACNDMAKTHGVQWAVVARSVARAGLRPVRTEARDLQRARRERIVALRNEGRTYGQIQQELGVSENQVRLALRAAKKAGRLRYQPGRPGQAEAVA